MMGSKYTWHPLKSNAINLQGHYGIRTNPHFTRTRNRMVTTAHRRTVRSMLNRLSKGSNRRASYIMCTAYNGANSKGTEEGREGRKDTVR